VTVVSPATSYNLAMHRSPLRFQRAGRLALTFTTLSVLIAGCGSSSPGGGSAGKPPQNIVAAAYKFSRCMRDHGVSNFPDPQIKSSNGGQQIAVRVVGSAGSPAFKSATKACQGIMPAATTSPVQIAQQQHAREQDLVSFAQCLRSHGVPDFPDPTSQGQLTPAMVTGAGVDLHAPATLTAAKACIGASHGAITGADVERAVNGPQ
jgi:hypothetical protein